MAADLRRGRVEIGVAGWAYPATGSTSRAIARPRDGDYTCIIGCLSSPNPKNLWPMRHPSKSPARAGGWAGFPETLQGRVSPANGRSPGLALARSSGFRPRGLSVVRTTAQQRAAPDPGLARGWAGRRGTVLICAAFVLVVDGAVAPAVVLEARLRRDGAGRARPGDAG